MNSVAMFSVPLPRRDEVIPNLAQETFVGAIIEFRFRVDPRSLHTAGWGTLDQVLADICLRDGHALLCRPQLHLNGGGVDFSFAVDCPSPGFGWRRPSAKLRPVTRHEIDFKISAVRFLPDGEGRLAANIDLTHRVKLNSGADDAELGRSFIMQSMGVVVISWGFRDRQFALAMQHRRLISG